VDVGTGVGTGAGAEAEERRDEVRVDVGGFGGPVGGGVRAADGASASYAYAIAFTNTDYRAGGCNGGGIYAATHRHAGTDVHRGGREREVHDCL
jgi:hypothetical protein